MIPYKFGGVNMALTIVLNDKNDYIRRFQYNGKNTQYTVSKDGIIYDTNGNIVKPHPAFSKDGGYDCVALRDKSAGLNKTMLVHRVVAKTFIPNPDDLPEVNHINLNKRDNRLCNLEWVSRSENSLHKLRNGIGPFLLGEKNVTSKYTDDQIEEVCKMLESGSDNVVISKKTGVSTAMVSMIKIGKVRQHQSSKYHWKKHKKSEMYGDNHHSLVINSDIARQICELLAAGERAKVIAKRFGIKKYVVDNIKYRTSWTYISKDYIW